MTADTLQPPARYSRVAAVLHWLIAGFILFNLVLGWFMEGFAPPLKMIVLPLHISGGITVLALSVLRVLWRLTHQPPPHVPPLRPLEEQGAHLVHFLLYCGMVLMPLTGWGLLSAHPAPGSAGKQAETAQFLASHPGAKAPGGGGLKVWWVIPLPSLRPIQAIGDTPGGLAPQKHLHDELVDWHSLGGFVMVGLLLLHVAGALKHQFLDGAPSLQRMSLRRPPSLRKDIS
jgi:cytochrome b561